MPAERGLPGGSLDTWAETKLDEWRVTVPDGRAGDRPYQAGRDVTDRIRASKRWPASALPRSYSAMRSSSPGPGGRRVPRSRSPPASPAGLGHRWRSKLSVGSRRKPSAPSVPGGSVSAARRATLAAFALAFPFHSDAASVRNVSPGDKVTVHEERDAPRRPRNEGMGVPRAAPLGMLSVTLSSGGLHDGLPVRLLGGGTTLSLFSAMSSRSSTRL